MLKVLARKKDVNRISMPHQLKDEKNLTFGLEKRVAFEGQRYDDRRCKVHVGAMRGMERKDSVGAPVSHNYTVFPRTLIIIVSFLFSLHRFPHRFPIIDHCSTPLPPAQDDCQQIEHVSSFTATHSTTAFPSFHLWITTISTSCKGAH
jgi:hypothetical protein